MSVFTRFKDIINANLSALLDRAEDPEKLLKLMIREMEDTLVELKASCAQAMASRTTVCRSLEYDRQKAEAWAAKAQLAVEKNREDLAREALLEKRAYLKKVETQEAQTEQLDAVVEQYRHDIARLEEKLDQARNKTRVLAQRHQHAQQARTAREQAERARSAEAMLRFDKFEQRVDHMEANAEMAGRQAAPCLEEEFAKLELDDDIERELDALRSKTASPA